MSTYCQQFLSTNESWKPKDHCINIWKNLIQLALREHCVLRVIKILKNEACKSTMWPDSEYEMTETGWIRMETNKLTLYNSWFRDMWVLVVPPEALYDWKSHDSVNWVGPTLIVPLLSYTHQIKAVYALFECVCHWFFWILWDDVKVTHVKHNRRAKQSHNKAIEWRIRLICSKKCTYCFIKGYFYLAFYMAFQLHSDQKLEL